MNQMSPRPMGLPALVPPMPRTSAWLTVAMNHAAASAALPPLVMPAGVAVAVAHEAHALLPTLRRRLQPATPGEWDEFLSPLVSATRNPPSEEDFEAFVAAAAVALVTIPAHLLTHGRRAEAVRRFDFWPSVADIAKWLEPEAREDRAALAAMERLAVAPEPAAVAVDEARTPEIIAAVADKMRAFKAEMHQQDERMRPQAWKVTARHLSPQQSIAALERQIAEGGDRSGMLAFLLQVERRKFESEGAQA